MCSRWGAKNFHELETRRNEARGEVFCYGRRFTTQKKEKRRDYPVCCDAAYERKCCLLKTGPLAGTMRTPNDLGKGEKETSLKNLGEVAEQIAQNSRGRYCLK